MEAVGEVFSSAREKGSFAPVSRTKCSFRKGPQTPSRRASEGVFRCRFPLKMPPVAGQEGKERLLIAQEPPEMMYGEVPPVTGRSLSRHARSPDVAHADVPTPVFLDFASRRLFKVDVRVGVLREV